MQISGKSESIIFIYDLNRPLLVVVVVLQLLIHVTFYFADKTTYIILLV